VNTAKDMKKIYAKTATVDLIKNRNRKQWQIWQLYGLTGYWVDKERARLTHMIAQIDQEIERRAEPIF